MLNLFSWLSSKSEVDRHRRTHINELFRKFKANEFIFDEDFDSLYEEPIKGLSAVQWTPVSVARRVMELLDLDAQDILLDVGSGVGKFCIIGAILSKAQIVGVEKRSALHSISKILRRDFKLKNLEFLIESMEKIDFRNFTAFYFYNPFYESLTARDRIDRALPAGIHGFSNMVQYAKNQLSQMPIGTKVATYHSLGGKMPSSYICSHREFLVTGDLEIWIKQK
jgi:predicted RNA methylase